MDRIIGTGLAWWVTVLFAGAALDKLRRWRAHQDHVQAYLMAFGAPSEIAQMVLKSVAACAVGIEVCASLLCVYGPTRIYGAALASGVLLVYALGLFLRHRREGDEGGCGCSWGGADVRLSLGLVMRNIVMALFVALIAWPQTARPLQLADIPVVVLLSLSCIVATSFASQAIGTHTSGAWLRAE